MTLSKEEQLRRRKKKASKLFYKTHTIVNVDDEALELIRLTKAFFRCKSNNNAIKEIIRAFIDEKIPFDCSEKERKMYKKYAKQSMQQYKLKCKEKQSKQQQSEADKTSSI
jgi:hypothetical protein